MLNENSLQLQKMEVGPRGRSGPLASALVSLESATAITQHRDTEEVTAQEKDKTAAGVAKTTVQVK